MSTPISEWSLDGIKNPLALQSMLLDEFENSSGGKYTIADGNNVVAFLMETFASVASSTIRKIDDAVLPAIFPSRATEIADLYKHLSDYDYVGLFSSPAVASIALMLDKASVLKSAVTAYDDDGKELGYKQLIIPGSTRFTIGGKSYGIYYPIIIKVNESSGMFIAEWDTTKTNPFHRLTTNVLSCSFYQQGQTTIAYVTIPVYQFDLSITEEPLVKGTGYHKTVSFNNKFYALRCFADVWTEQEDGSYRWVNTELSLSMYGRKYDPETPTVIFSVDPKNNYLYLDVPYVYFTNNLLRGNLKLEIYTTEGYINYTAPANTEELVGISMFDSPLDSVTEKYASPFRTLTMMTAVPITMNIVGGTDGMSYEDLRRRILYNSFTDKTLQTPQDIDAFFADRGYTTTIYQDGLTDRVFLAHAVLRGAETNEVVSSACLPTLFDKSLYDEKGVTSSIIKSPDGSSYTILPSTRYRFDTTTGMCIPLTDDEFGKLNSMPIEERIAAYNDNYFTFCPYHVCVIPSDKYPRAIMFDMTDTDIVSREFIGTNTKNPSVYGMQQTLDTSIITAYRSKPMSIPEASDDDKFTEAYVLNFRISRSGMDGYQPDMMPVLVGIKTVDGSYYWISAKNLGDRENYTATFYTSSLFKQVNGKYAINVNNKATVYLESEVRVLLGLLADGRGDRFIDAVPSLDVNTDVLNNSLVVMSEYKIVCRFGKIINQIDPRVSVTFAGNNYLKFNTTSFLTLETPQYKKDANGVPVIEGTPPHLVKEFEAGTLLGYTQLDTAAETVAVTDIEAIEKDKQDCPVLITVEEDGVDKNVEVPYQTYVSEHKSDPDFTWTVPLRQRCFPRFNVSGASRMGIKTSPVIGTYDLADAGSHIGKLSAYTDVWYMTLCEVGGEKKATAKQPLDRTYKLSVVDQLWLIRNLSLSVPGHVVKEFSETDTEYLKGNRKIKSITPTDGKFVYVSDDKCDDYGEGVIEIGTIVAGTGVSKLYQAVGSKWVCIAKFAVTDDDTDILKPVDEALAGLTRPLYGFAYYLSPNNPEDAGTFDEDYVLYASFLSLTEQGAVDLSLIHYEDDSVPPKPLTPWEDYINKWPWDVTVWRRFTSDLFQVDEQFEIAIDAVRCAKYAEHLTDQVKLDANGNPQIDPNNIRKVQYNVNMLHMDAKLLETTQKFDSGVYPMTSVLRGHFDALGAVKNRLFTGTRLYFEPSRSMGYATFSSDGDTVIDHVLDISMKFRLHVNAGIAEDVSLQESLKESIISLIDDELEHGNVSMVHIANLIREQNSDSVKYVDVLGIDGDPNLQTLRCVDADVRPHLKHSLILLEDKTTVELSRALELSFVIADD